MKLEHFKIQLILEVL